MSPTAVKTLFAGNSAFDGCICGFQGGGSLACDADERSARGGEGACGVGTDAAASLGDEDRSPGQGEVGLDRGDGWVGGVVPLMGKGR
jgi:hypothetical protein